MCKEDIVQVTEIDREAFPTPWPQANYNRELENRLAHYVVACGEEEEVEELGVEASLKKDSSKITSRVKRLFNYNHFFSSELPQSGGQSIVGFAGFWIMAGEAHITNIAVRKLRRRQGVGELLLIAVIDLATGLNARIVTLEVRGSNTIAQSLYHKYGFIQAGIRHNYYIENKEDAVIMSTGSIVSAPFQVHLQQLKKAHSRKWGIALYQIVR
ncbi:ribosomal protein S18-alanine N-acetyltransferase [Chloroflexota bacterium]